MTLSEENLARVKYCCRPVPQRIEVTQKTQRASISESKVVSNHLVHGLWNPKQKEDEKRGYLKLRVQVEREKGGWEKKEI